MKKALTLLFLLVGFTASAQHIAFDKDTAFNADSNHKFDIAVSSQVTNNSSDSVFILKRTLQYCALEETAFCDQTLCYPTWQDEAEVVIRPQESFPLKVYFYPNNKSGCCKLYMTLTAKDNPSNSDSCLFRACTLDVNAVSEVDPGRVSVYPNPAYDRIQLKTGNKQAYEVRVYDILGNLLISKAQFLDGQSLNIGDLPSGVYVIRTRGEFASSTTFKKF